MLNLLKKYLNEESGSMSIELIIIVVVVIILGGGASFYLINKYTKVQDSSGYTIDTATGQVQSSTDFH